MCSFDYLAVSLTWKQTWGGGGRGRAIEPFKAPYKGTLHDWGPTSLFLVLFVRCMMVTAALLQSWSGCVAPSSLASSIRLATSSLSSSVRTVASLQEASWHPTPPVWWHFAELLYHTPKADLDNFFSRTYVQKVKLSHSNLFFTFWLKLTSICNIACTLFESFFPPARLPWRVGHWPIQGGGGITELPQHLPSQHTVQLDHPELQWEQRQLHVHCLRPGELIHLFLWLLEGTHVKLVRSWFRTAVCKAIYCTVYIALPVCIVVCHLQIGETCTWQLN